ncbi:MAG: PorV/PorQ family protein [Gemmatimonadota bacterium]|nr:MAG: PorV/PorQ family protein [Gemmatimonadota bacterium]
MRLKLSNAAALATLAALASPSFSAAQEPPRGGSASEGAEFLLLPVGARAVGMGGAVTGMRGIGELVLWNPAGIASMTDRRLLFNHSESAFDTRSDVLSLAWPIRSIGTFGLTYYLVDYGELTSTDPSGSVTGTINFRNQEFLLTYATRIAGPLEFGINYKLIQLIFRCDGVCAGTQSFTRTTHAFDFGLIWAGVAGVPLSLGGSLRHLGFPLEGEDEDDPLPTRVRVGMAYQALSTFTADSSVTLVLTLDLEDQTRELGAPEVMIGSEFGVADLFFIRAGYAFLDTGFGGPTLGLGVTYDWFYLDLSRGFDEISSATGEDAVQVSFGIIF